jgi:hypothetical protein
MLCCALLLAPPAMAADLRDPTQPPATVSTATRREPAPILSAVLKSGYKRGAIFNGQFVRSGGSVGNYTIIAVLDDGVRYRYAGRELELRLPPPASTFKKPATGPARGPAGVEP